MDFLTGRIRVIGLLLLLIVLASCRPASPVPIVVDVPLTPGWQTYNNQKYNFSMEYPPGWQVKEILAAESLADHDEVWFAAEAFPLANTAAQPDMNLIITMNDPSAQWGPEYFDGYQTELIPFGNGRATRVSGINKESLQEEVVFLMELNGVYMQALPGTSQEASEFFDRILASLKPAPEAISITVPPVSSATADPCVFPYFDPVAFLPQNDRILIRSEMGISVFNLETFEKELTLQPPRRQVVKAALSPTGQTLAWALDDNSVELVDLDSGVVLAKLIGHAGLVTAIKFSATGNRIYTGSHDGSVRAWNDDGSLVSEILPSGGEVLGIGVSPDDRRLIIVTFEGTQKLWNLRTNRLIRNIGSTGAFDGADAGFSPDGKTIWIGLGGGPVSLWKANTRVQVWSGGDYAIALSPNGRFFAYSETEENGDAVIVINSLDGLKPIQVLKRHGSMIWKIVFSPDGSLLASADGNEIRIWRVNDGTLLYTLKSICP